MQEVLATLWTKIVKKHLHKEECGKLDEKVFLRRIAVALGSIVLCMSAMGFTAYAYFTSSITSSANTIKAASYSADAEITKDDGSSVTAEAGAPLSYSIENAGTYKITLKATGTATTGYCKIEIIQADAAEGQEAKTATLFTAQMAPEKQMSFKLVINTAVKVVVTPQWGTYANRNVVVEDGMKQEILFAEETSSTSTDTTTSGVATPEQQSESATVNPGEISTGTSEDTTETPTDTQTPSTDTGTDEGSTGDSGNTDTSDDTSEETGGEGTTGADEDISE